MNQAYTQKDYDRSFKWFTPPFEQIDLLRFDFTSCEEYYTNPLSNEFLKYMDALCDLLESAIYDDLDKRKYFLYQRIFLDSKKVIKSFQRDSRWEHKPSALIHATNIQQALVYIQERL